MSSYVSIVTLLALIFYLNTLFAVGGARGKSGIAAPTMTGDPILERAVRVQMNTLESLPVFLTCLWLFAVFVPYSWGSPTAAVLGLIWIVGRILYQRGYMADPSKRSTGFLIQGAATIVLLLGALIGSGISLAHGG